MKVRRQTGHGLEARSGSFPAGNGVLKGPAGPGPYGRRLWWHALRGCARFNRPDLAAFLFCRALARVVKAQARDRIRVLVLSKEGLFEDVVSSLAGDGRFEIYGLNMVRNKALKALASVFLPPEVHDSNYVSRKPEVVEAKKRYRAFLDPFWRHVQARIHADVVLSANFAYYAERELAAVMERRGTPFVVLHKENLKNPGKVAFFQRLYREKRGGFFGRKVLVYNTIERDLQVETGAVARDRVLVTGMPRLDRMHQWRRETAATERKGHAGRQQVLFFTFDAGTGLPRVPRAEGGGFLEGFEALGRDIWRLSWTRLAAMCHDAVVRFAREHPEVCVVIKAKRKPPKDSPVYEVLRRYEPSIPNLEVVLGGDPFELIVGSNVVAGFNTTALFEALAAGIPVVVPRFAEALEDKMQAYIVDMGRVVTYAHSSEDLVERLAAAVTKTVVPSRSLDPEVEEILDKWVGNPDGAAGQRVKSAVLGEILSGPVRAV